MHEPGDRPADRIVRGALALTTYVGALTATELEVLDRLTRLSARRRLSDPRSVRPRTEAA